MMSEAIPHLVNSTSIDSDTVAIAGDLGYSADGADPDGAYEMSTFNNIDGPATPAGFGVGTGATVICQNEQCLEEVDASEEACPSCWTPTRELFNNNFPGAI